MSKPSYDKAIAQFGEQGTVELISTIGYYAMVGIFLKSFGVRPPDGSTPLQRAVFEGTLAEVKRLLAAGADPA